MKFKIDQYRINNKGRQYDVLVFPKSKNAWAFYEDSDDQYMIDGDSEFYTLLQHALAALIADPSKIIYFPIKHPDETRYGANLTYDAVLVRPELQFRRSEWYDLKSKLDRKHWTGKYAIRHDQKKIDDWWLKEIPKYPQWIDHWGRRMDRKFYEGIVDELIGETVFLVLPQDVCYMYHWQITQALEKYNKACQYGVYAGIGFLMPHQD